MSNKQRRQQKQKPNLPRNEEWMRAKLDQARSTAGPQPLKTLYKRKPKHTNKGWD